eukprot:COSAG04_NODE_2871_length_3441_cov_2.444943_1_plen_298_part_00
MDIRDVAQRNYTAFHKRAMIKAILIQNESAGLAEQEDEEDLRSQLEDMELPQLVEEVRRRDVPVGGASLTPAALERRVGAPSWVDSAQPPSVEDLNDTTLGEEGWAGNELIDDDRDMLDKSKLLLTDAWAQTEYDSAQVAQGKLVLGELRNFEGSLKGNPSSRHKENQDFVSHFKEELQPVVLAWIASQYGLQVELARAKKQIEVRGELRELRFHVDALEGNIYICPLCSLEGPLADIEFFDTGALKRHEMERELLQEFIDNLRKTDEKQKWVVCRKVRKLRCGKVECGAIACGCSW